MPEESVSGVAGGDARWSRRSVLLAGGLLMAGCGGPEAPVIKSKAYDTKSNRGKLNKILDRRAKALLDKDEQAYLADLDSANDDLIRREKLLFANLRQFDLAECRYVLDAGNESQADGVTTFAPVIRVTKLSADADIGDVAPAETFVYKVRADGDRLLVTDIVRATLENSEELALRGPLAHAPWHTDELRVEKVGGKVWLVGDSTVTDLDRYAAVAERELGAVERLWGDRVTFPGHVLFFSRDLANIREWFGVGRGQTGNDALGYQIRLHGVRKNGQYSDAQYAASRIVVNLGAIEAHDTDPAKTIRHELTHAVTARGTLSGDIFQPPTWAIEGFARYTETIDNPARAAQVRAHVAAGVRAGKFTGTTPPSKAFYGKDVIFNYALGATVFTLAERLKGRDAAVELYATLITRADSADRSFFELPIFDAISQRILGMSSGSFRGRWNSFVRNGA